MLRSSILGKSIFNSYDKTIQSVCAREKDKFWDTRMSDFAGIDPSPGSSVEQLMKRKTCGLSEKG